MSITAAAAETDTFLHALQGLRDVSATLATAGHRLTHDEYGLLLAETVALRADCTRRRVGAVIIDRERRIVGTGYNGAPAGHPGCLSAGACPRGRTSYAEVPKDSTYATGAGGINCIALHAEENALLHSARTDRSGATIYITDKPCPNCERILSGSGLARAVWMDASTATICTRALITP